MPEDGFDVHELDKLTEDLFRIVQKEYPNAARAMMRKQGKEGREKLRENTKAVTTTQTGELAKGVRAGKVYKYEGDFQIRVKNTLPHAHLIEYGHSNVKKRKGKSDIPVGSFVRMTPPNVGPFFIEGKKEVFVPGKYPARKTAEEMSKTFPKAVEKFVDDLIEEHLL